MIGLAERKINIKDLVLPEVGKHPDGSFNPCNLIDSADWQKMVNVLNASRKTVENNQGLGSLLRELRGTYYSMLMLFPEKRDDLGLDDSLNSILSKQDPPPTIDTRTIREVHLRTIFQKGTGFATSYDPGFYPFTIMRSDKERGLDRLTALAHHKIIDPNIPLDWIHDKQIKEKISSFYKRDSMYGIAELAASSKILYGRWNFLGIDDERFWKLAKIEFEQQKKSINQTLFPYFAEFAANLKILAAKEIKFGEFGLELVLPEAKLDDSTSLKLPESRRF